MRIKITESVDTAELKSLLDEIKDALNYANLAASFTVQRPGAQQSIPYLEEILNSEKKGNN